MEIRTFAGWYVVFHPSYRQIFTSRLGFSYDIPITPVDQHVRREILTTYCCLRIMLIYGCGGDIYGKAYSAGGYLAMRCVKDHYKKVPISIDATFYPWF